MCRRRISKYLWWLRGVVSQFSGRFSHILPPIRFSINFTGSKTNVVSGRWKLVKLACVRWKNKNSVQNALKSVNIWTVDTISNFASVHDHSEFEMKQSRCDLWNYGQTNVIINLSTVFNTSQWLPKNVLPDIYRIQLHSLLVSATSCLWFSLQLVKTMLIWAEVWGLEQPFNIIQFLFQRSSQVALAVMFQVIIHLYS